MKALPVYLIAFSLCAFAQTPDTTTPQTPSGPPAGLGGRGAPDPEPKPYDKVITKDAKSKTGVFTVHKVKNKTYYEIPASELGKDFLWVSQIARTTLGAGYGGQMAGSRVVRWERHDNRVLLRSVSFEIVADEKLPISKAVHAANNDTIVMAFNIAAFGKNDAPVIDIDRLFTTEVPEFSPRTRLRARAMDASRSFLESVHPYPTNIEVEATQTFTSSTDTPTSGGGAPTPPNPLGAAGMRPGSAAVLMPYSRGKRPRTPMPPRRLDTR